MNDTFKSIGAFVNHYFQHNQAALVDELLQNDEQMKLYNDLYNLDWYTAILSTGNFAGIHKDLMMALDNIHQLLQEKDNPILIADGDKLETATPIERTVFEWYVIPYWIANYLRYEGEVILGHYNCYWWGRTITGQFIGGDDVIKQLFISFR